MIQHSVSERTVGSGTSVCVIVTVPGSARLTTPGGRVHHVVWNVTSTEQDTKEMNHSKSQKVVINLIVIVVVMEGGAVQPTEPLTFAI